MEKRSSFVNGAAILAVAGLLVKFIGAAYRIPLSNIIGNEGGAYYDIVYRYYAWLLVVSSSGLPTAISKLVSERVTLGDYRGARAVFRTSWRLLLIIGVTTTLLMFFGANLLSGITYSGITTPEEAAGKIANLSLSFRALAPSLLFVSLMCAYRGYLQGLQRMTGTAISQVAEQVFKLIFGFTLASMLLPKGPEHAAMGALIGVSISELIALIVMLAFYRRRKGALDAMIRRSPKLNRGMTFSSISKALLTIAVPVTIGASIMPLTGIIDSAFIIRLMTGSGFSVDQADTAYSLLYTRVTPIINMPAVLTVALAMSLVPAISSYMAKKDVKNVRNAARTGMKLAFIIGTPCAIGMFVLAEPIIRMLYGSSLTTSEIGLAAELMQTACVGVVFLSLVQTLTGVIQGLGKPNVPVLNLLFGGVLKVGTLFILMRIPEINIQGAAVSTVVCYAVAGVLNMIYLIRKTNMKISVLDVFLKPIFSSVFMGVVVHFVYRALSASMGLIVSTLASVGIGVFLYVAAVLFLRMFSAEDLRFLPGGSKLKRFARKDD